MPDYILREEENRFHVYILIEGQDTRYMGCEESEQKARNHWAQAKSYWSSTTVNPNTVDLFQSRTCVGEPMLLLKKGSN